MLKFQSCQANPSLFKIKTYGLLNIYQKNLFFLLIALKPNQFFAAIDHQIVFIQKFSIYLGYLSISLTNILEI